MKKILFSLFLFSLTFGFSQKITDSTTVVMSSKEVFLFDTFNSTVCSTSGKYEMNYMPGDLLYISNIYNCKSSIRYEKIAEVFFNEKKYYLKIKGDEFAIINGEQVPISEVETFISTLTPVEYNKLNEVASSKSGYYIEFLKNKLYEKIFKNSKNGIGILEAYPVENYSMTDAKFRILNFSKKTIKYVTFSFLGKNAVNDNVGGVVTKKGIGPIESLETGSWSFETAWLTDIVETMKLLSVSVIYMDGTTRKYLINDSFWVDEDAMNRFTKLSED